MTYLMTEETRVEVVQNPLNDSTSKNLWSFPRDKRFKSEQSLCPHVAYNYNLSTNPKRQAAIGYGGRTEFKLKNYFVPSGADYDPSRMSTGSNIGKTFGTSREVNSSLTVESGI
jgi:hypothetical protein